MFSAHYLYCLWFVFVLIFFIFILFFKLSSSSFTAALNATVVIPLCAYNDNKISWVLMTNICVYVVMAVFFLTYTWVVTNPHFSLFILYSCITDFTIQHKHHQTPECVQFSLFSVSTVRCKRIAFLSLLLYILQKPLGTSTSAREVSKPDWKQNSYAILKMHTAWSPPCCSKNSCRSAFDPFWHLLHYLPFMNNELNITTALKIPVKISSEIMHSSF